MDAKRRPPLGQYLYDQRHALGLTMADAAARAETSAAYWSQIEGGQVKLPGADLRRRIARALGIRHVDILIAAGELTADEAGTGEAATPDALAPVYRRLDPAIRKVIDNPATLERWLRSADHTADMLAGLSLTPGTARPGDAGSPTAPAATPDARRDR